MLPYWYPYVNGLINFYDRTISSRNKNQPLISSEKRYFRKRDETLGGEIRSKGDVSEVVVDEMNGKYAVGQGEDLVRGVVTQRIAARRLDFKSDKD